MTKVMTAVEAYREIREHGEQELGSRPLAPKVKQFPEAASPGDNVRQGDIYIELLECVPKGAKPWPKESGRLVPSTGQGSDHILQDHLAATWYLPEQKGPLDGPIFVLDKPGLVTHPEHDHWVLPGEGRVYGITYQRAWDQEEIRRVQD